MTKFFFATILLIISQVNAFSQESELPRRKPLVFETTLVDNKKPNAVIIGSKEPEIQALALEIQKAVRKSTGVKLDIVSDEAIATHRGELLQAEPTLNMIVLGNLDNNGIIAHLYFKAYCAVDANYPGKSNYVIQTISDPWATGANAIVLGGSNLAGIRNAVNRFCADLPKGATLTIPRTLRAEGDGTFQASDLSDNEIAKKLAEAEVEFKAGKHNGLFPSISAAATAYNLYGKESQAKLCRDLIFLEHHLLKTSPN